MDNLTHSLVGALIGQAGLKRKTGLAMPALIVGANIPDIDAACLLWLDGVQHLGFRRGITHGPIAWVFLPLLLAGGLWWWDRWQARRGKRPDTRLPVHFGWLYALSFLATLTHPALDWLNVYGVRLLEPFSSRWFYGDILFIVDVWLWALMGFATWFSLRREKRGGEWMRPARIAIAAGLAYIGVNGLISDRASAEVAEHDNAVVIASPVPLFPWQREVIRGTVVLKRYCPFGNNSRRSSGGENYSLCSTDFSQRYFVSDWSPWAVAVNERLLPNQSCSGLASVPTHNNVKDWKAFIFWSRAPFAERAADGSVLIRDARFYDPRARDRFTVALPDVRCDPL